MTDLLTRLALRAVGEGLHVRPRAPPVFGGVEATDVGTTAQVRRDGGGTAPALRDPREPAPQARHRDAAARSAAWERGDARLDPSVDGAAVPARDVADARGDARAPRIGPGPFEQSPRAIDLDADTPGTASPAAFPQMPRIDVRDAAGEVYARAPAAVVGSAVHPAASFGARTRAASNTVPATPDPQPTDVANEAPYAEAGAWPDRELAYPAHVPARTPASGLRAAVRRGAAPQPPATQADAAPRDEPIVHVTIGRVEVRAWVPAAPPAPRAAPAGPRPLSLDGYLASRKGSAP